MDEDIDIVLRDTFRVVVRLELLIFFTRNQYAMDTARKFATFVKRPESFVKQELDYLTKCGLVDKMGEGDTAIYSFTNDLELIQKVDEFCRNLSKRRVS
jgi:hypothetical protein